MDLLALRKKIDEIDAKMVALYENRMELAGKVAEYKIENGKQVFDKEREIKKIEEIKSLTHNEFNRLGAEELFEQIMAMSRKLQYQLLTQHGQGEECSFHLLSSLDKNATKVVFQGADGAYSKIAMEQYFGSEIDSFHVDTFKEAMTVIQEGQADFAVLPIENSSAGIVSEIYDLLVAFENYIVGEQIIPIKHCLLGVKGAKTEEITTVFSHPQSLMQSAEFLGKHPKWRQISMQNNAFAAKKVAQEGNRAQAAIASEQAGLIYGLEVLQKEINDNLQNSTRFIVIANKKVFTQEAKKISICFEIPHKSGSLYRILSHFIYNNINMNKIESRPIGEKNWEYRFFIDFDGKLTDSSVRNALRGLQEEANNLKILGNY